MLFVPSTDHSCVNIIFTKTRLTPIKGMTIPQLKLMAVLIGVRCVKFVVSQLHLDIEQVYVWSDSQCVLKWLTSNKKSLGFCQNRVKEITDHKDIKYRFISTNENAADVASNNCVVINYGSMGQNG